MGKCKSCRYLDPHPKYETGDMYVAQIYACLNPTSERFGDGCCNRTTYGKRTVDTRELQTCKEFANKP